MTPPATERTDPAAHRPSPLDPISLGLVVVGIILLIVVGLALWVGKAKDVGAELRAYDAESIEAIEDRYDVTVDDWESFSLSEWTIDGKKYVCEVTDLSQPSIGLSCVSGDAFADFATLAEPTR